MRFAIATLLLVLSLAADAKDDAIPAPENWRRESFEFPLAFAPGIGFEGSEHVRFAPGWGEFASDRGFRYVFLWDVKSVPGPSQAVHGLEFALGVYFDGLMETAAATRKLEARGARTVVNFHPMREVKGWNESHAGAIHTWNAFGEAEPLVLNVEVTKRECPAGRTQVFFAISKAARGDALWNDLRKAREATTC
jgi:hypothetical protein